jgi:hypothetical protein
MDQRIVDFYNHYHTRKVSRPELYVSGRDSINVILPNNLLEYANAAAGHSGFGAGARARGIRRQVNNSTKALAEIFASPENLLKFLNTSEMNAEAYVEGIRAKHLAQSKPAIPVNTDELKASVEFWNRYTKDDLQNLLAKHGRDKVQKAYNSLTIKEFEIQFGLQKEVEVIQ